MQNYKKNFVTRTLAWVLAAVMVIAMVPVGVFAEVEKADWTIDEKKEAEMSFWKLSDINEVVVVANAEGMKTPCINYIGTYINAEGRTVVRVSFRVFQNLATAVWHNALFKFDNDLYKLIDFDDSGTGMYKGVENGDWHDSETYKEVAPFTKVVSSLSGAVNVKEQSLKNNKNLVGGNCRSEIPIDLVLKAGKTVADIKGQPHIQMRLASDDYKRIFCVAGTGKAKDDPANNDDSAVDQNTLITPYNSYTFMTYIPSANNNADVNTVEDYNRNYQFYAANSYAKYNEAGGYLDVFHKQSKMNSGDNIGGESFAFRQVFNEKFAEVLKPQDKSGTVAEVFAASQQGDMWKTTQPIKITKDDLNTSENSDLNPGFTGIQVASTFNNGTIGQKFAGLKTVLTTTKPKESFLNSATTEFNSGLPTITRYYIDKDKVAEKGLKNDDLASFDFYSTFILDSAKKFIEYTATNNTGKDIVLQPNSKIGLTYVDGKTSTPNTGLKKYSLTFGEGPYKIELRSNFKHTGKGLNYEYTLIPGMTIKAGEKITFRTMKYDTIPSKVILTLPGTDGDKTIDLVTGADGAELTTPRRLNYVTTYAGGSATQSGINPDIDELFTDSQNITGRTRYAGAKIKLFYPNNTDYEFTIADQKTRTTMNVNGAEVNGYTFTTEGKAGFTMPTGLVKDSQIGITNTDVKKASTPSDKAFEKVQAKVTFDLNGGKLATTVKSFEGFDTAQLPGTEFAYKLKRANDTAPVVRIAPMNEKAASEEGYTPNGFKVANYIDHNGDALKGDALELRKFVSDVPTKDGVVFYGWTTKKVTSVDDYNKLGELKTADQAKDTTKTYKFTENSPVLTGTTVYAFYGPLKSQVTNPTQTYDEVKDKQYIEIAAEDGSIPTDATYKLVKKNEDGTYTEVEGLTQTTKEDRTPVFDITDLTSDKFEPDADYYIETTETGKKPSYSNVPIKIDKVAPIESTNDDEKITATPDLFNYMVKITGKAKDDDHKIIKATVEANGNTVEVEATTNDDEFSIELQDYTLKQLGEAVSYKVTIYDEMGNKLEKVLEVTKVEESLALNIFTASNDDTEIFLKSKTGAALTIRVVRNNTLINLDAASATKDEHESIKLMQDGAEFKLKTGDRIIVDAKLDGYKDARILTIVR